VTLVRPKIAILNPEINFSLENRIAVGSQYCKDDDTGSFRFGKF